MEIKYTCIIADDEPLARKLLTKYIEQTPPLVLKASFKSAPEVIDHLKTHKVDLIISDIKMPGVTGISMLQNNDIIPPVIFTTAYEAYAVQAFELDVIDYLVKPFPLERFQKAVRRFEEYAGFKKESKDNSRHLMVKTNHGFVRIAHTNILYIEAKGEYMKLILTDQLPELIYIRMKELQHQLGNGFIRIHKSYLVNKSKISKLSGNEVMVGDDRLKVSRLYKQGLLKALAAKIEN